MKGQRIGRIEMKRGAMEERLMKGQLRSETRLRLEIIQSADIEKK